MATKNFYINDGLKVKGDTLLNGSSYSDSALSKLHVKTAANGAGANLNNVNGLLIENSSSSASHYALKLATGAGNILSVTDSGNVGMGTVSPGTKLDITGTFRVSDWGHFANTGENQIVLGSSGSNFGFIMNPSAGVWSLGYGSDRDALGTSVLSWSSSNLVTINNAYNLFLDGGNITLENSAGDNSATISNTGASGSSKINVADALYVIEGGNVGIGTTDPNEKLTVSGNISASGTIYADAFNSKTGGTTIDFNDDIDLNGNLTFSSSSDILIPDNAGAALEIKEGSNVYQRFITTNGGEKIELYKCTTASAGFTTNSLSATSLSGATGAGVTTGATIALGGDLGGSVALDTLDGTKTLTATIQANSVALGTDTTGNYVQSLALNTTTPSLTGSSLAAAEGNTITGLGLSATGVTANSYGSTTVIPVITVLEDGRISNVSTSSIPTDLTIAADSGSNDTVTIGTDTLTFAGTSNEVDTTVSNNQIQIGLPNAVSVATSLSTPLILAGDGSVSAPSYSFTGDTNTGMWRPGSDQLRFNTGGVDRLCLTSSLATFTNSVCINDNITVAGNLTVHGACTTLNTTVTATSAFRVDNDGTGPALVANQTGSQPIADFQDDGTSVFYIEDGGNVGLGTTNPEAGLHIFGSGQQALFVGSSNGARALLELDGASNGDGAGGDYAYLAHNADGSFDIKNLQNNSTNFATGSAGTTKMTITSGGNVGIGGITTPESPLQVCGSENSFQAHFGRQTNGTACWVGISLGYAENANNLYRKVGIAAKTTGDVHARQELHFLVDSVGDSGSATITDSKMMIASAGNVGIGTTSPGYKLEVSADTNSTVNLLRLRNADATYSQTWDFQSDTNKDLVITGGSATGGVKMLPGSRGLVLQNTGNDVKFTLDRTDARTYSLYTESNGSLRIKDEDASTDRISILSGGNVGIGNTNPNKKLSVTGEVSGTSHATFDSIIRSNNQLRVSADYSINYFYKADNTTMLGYLLMRDNNNSFLSFPAGQDFRILHDSTSRIAVASAGNVGIGTTDPNEKLTVSGSISGSSTFTIGNAGDTGGLTVSPTGGTNAYGLSLNRSALSRNSPDIWDNIGDAIVIGAASSDTTLAIVSGGNVGIGTTTPGALLEIYSSAPVLGIKDGGAYGTNATSYIDFKDGSSVMSRVGVADTAGTLDINNLKANSIRLQTNNSTRVTLTSAGNFGIGTTNSFSKLTVAEGTDQHGVEIQPGTLSYIQAYDRATSDYGDLTIDAQTLRFATDTGAERVRIDVGGNVGIGTASPEGKLHIYTGNSGGSVNSSADELVIESASTGGIQFLNGSTASGYILFGDSGGNSTGQIRYLHSDDSMRLTTANVERLIINSSGNVGIGNIAPGGKLEISESGTNTELEVSTWSTTDSHNSFLRFQKSASATVNTLAATAAGEDLGEIQARGVDTNSTARTAARILFQGDAAPDADAVPGRIIFSTSTTSALVERMRIDDDGNVGIGTTTPAQKLDVIGRIRSSFNSGDYFEMGSSDSGGFLLGFSGTTEVVNVRTYGDSYFNGGNFGIGTASPDYNLHVKGSTSATIGLEGTSGSKDTWEITSSDLGGKAVLNFRNDDVSSTILTLHQDGCVIPGTDNTIDLGSSSKRWANVYANCTTTGAVIESNLCTNGLDSCPEGSVVIWRDGKLQGTTDAYSHRVMGVTAPGSESPIVMGAENILVTGDIEEGDTIVTSNKYNHGMRGSRSEDLHGKVIAEALESGSGESYIIKGMIRKF